MFILWGFFLSYRLVLSYSFALLNLNSLLIILLGQWKSNNLFKSTLVCLIRQPNCLLPVGVITLFLVPGAAPVSSRPYRFSPTIQDEVEK